MRVLAIVHQRDAGPGVFAEAIRSRGVELDSWLQTEDHSPPRDPGDYDAVLIFGGAMHADQEEEHPWLHGERALLAELVERSVPLLGVCLGAQLLAQAAGGEARRAPEPEIGWHGVSLTPEGADDPLLAPLSSGFVAFQWHSYEFSLPTGATPLATSPVCLQAYRLAGPAWGIQFHAEVTPQDAEKWIHEYREDEDAVRIGVDQRSLRERTRYRIGAWNELGRGLCKRFLDLATRG